MMTYLYTALMLGHVSIDDIVHGTLPHIEPKLD